MITRRFKEARGLHSDAEAYGFFVRVSGEDRTMLRQAKALAYSKFGDAPSNPLLLHEMMRVYLGHKGVFEEPQQVEDDDDFESDI